MKRNYAIYDVFTDTALTGNPLAVVFDSEGLDTAQMQRIAGEFNLSETVFVAPAANAMHSVALRIFTPRAELPFAGHPTVGSAIALVESGLAGPGNQADAILVLEEQVGPVRCGVKMKGGAAYAEFDLPRTPEQMRCDIGKETIAAALGIGAHDIGFENHVCGLWSAGLAYLTVPVHGLEVAGRIRMDQNKWLEAIAPVDGHVPAPYVYCRETVSHDCGFHARMFAPYDGIIEDPATGSAVAAFAGAMALHDQPIDGPTATWIEQGVEMGRPSKIRIELDMAGGAIHAARIGGHAVRVAKGHLEV